MVGELDGKVVAIGGFAHYAGRIIAFIDMKEEASAFLSEVGLDVQSIAATVDGKFMSAFVRARKP